VRSFLDRHHGWEAEPILIRRGRNHGDGRLLTPGHDATDGFYFARLRRMA
jgi:16S rRNA (cytosine967-C5)-methyltransferase